MENHNASPLVLCGGLSAHCSLAFHASHADARAAARACNFLMDVAYRCKNQSRRMQLLPYAGLCPFVVRVICPLRWVCRLAEVKVAKEDAPVTTVCWLRGCGVTEKGDVACNAGPA